MEESFFKFKACVHRYMYNSEARCLKSHMPFIVCESSECTGETVQRNITRAFAARLCHQYQNFCPG